MLHPKKLEVHPPSRRWKVGADFHRGWTWTLMGQAQWPAVHFQEPRTQSEYGGLCVRRLQHRVASGEEKGTYHGN